MIKLSQSHLGPEEVAAVSEVILGSKYLGMGPKVQAFEKAIGEFLHTDRSVVCVNTGTSALHLAVAAACEPGTEVIIPTITYVASFQAVSAAGCIPVACEVDPTTGCIDLVDAAARITERTSAIMPVHYGGGLVDSGALAEFREQYKVRIIEDAAHAFGARVGDQHIGAVGDIVCFSFDGIKNITSGEGGAIVTADETVAQRARDARLLGVERDTERRFSGQRSWQFDVTRQGYRYHMGDMHAAIGLCQLAKADTLFAIRQDRVAQYHAKLQPVAGISVLPLSSPDVVPHIYPVRVAGGQRDALRDFLQTRDIETGVHYFPNHQLTLYGGGQESLPKAEQLYSELLTLPLHPNVTVDDVDTVIDAIIEFMQS